MSLHLTKLFLAGVVAVALLALGITLIPSPAWAPPKPSLSKLTCTIVGHIPKWTGTVWECAPDEERTDAEIQAVVGPHTIDTDTNLISTDIEGFGFVKGAHTTDTDTLGGLGCATDQIAKWNGSAWVCADVLDGTGPKTVFVTSGTFTGDLLTQGEALSGLRGGDEICQDAAEEGIVPPGTYIAWLSNSNKDAKDRLPPNNSGFFLPDGVTKVADDKTDLTNGSIDHRMDQDEFGDPVPAFGLVWTGTSGDGTRYPLPGPDCTGWTLEGSGAGGVGEFGRVGSPGAVNGLWTNLQAETCDGFFHLYCFQR